LNLVLHIGMEKIRSTDTGAWMKTIIDSWISPMVNGDVPKGKQFNFCFKKFVSSLLVTEPIPCILLHCYLLSFHDVLFRFAIYNLHSCVLRTERSFVMLLPIKVQTTSRCYDRAWNSIFILFYSLSSHFAVLQSHFGHFCPWGGGGGDEKAEGRSLRTPDYYFIAV
jgi:hypothetical protein